MIDITIEELKILITAETAQLKSELKKTKQQLEGLNSKTTKVCSQMNTSFKNIFKGVSFVTILAALTKIISKAVELSSNLEEVQNVVDTAFGSMAQEVNSFAKNALESFGMSELSAKRMASTFMAMSNGMGIAKKQGKDMALVLTQLAGDMSSFYNVSQDVAETALKSIYTGETEALKKFGVVLTETNLEAFAASLGKSYKNMSQMEKATLRYQYVLKATSQAQGDFAKTSNSWANQTRILKEQINQLLSIIGKGIQNVLLPVVKGLNKILNYAIQVANVFAEVFGWSKSEMGKELENVTEELENATDQAKELKRETAGFDELNIIGTEATEKEDPAGKIESNAETPTIEVKEPKIEWVEKLKAVLLEIKGIINSFGSIFKDDDLTFAEKLKQVWQLIKEEIQITELTKPFVDLKTTVDTTNQSIAGLNNLLAAVPENLGKIALAAGAIFGVKSALDFLSSAYANNMALFDQLGKNLFSSFDAIKISLAQLGNTIVGGLGNALGFIKSGLAALMSPMGLVIASIALLAAGFVYAYSTSQEFRDKVNSCVKTVADTIKSFYNNVLAPMGDKISEVFNTLATSFTANVLPGIQKVMGAIGELWNNILLPLWQFLQPILIFIAGEFVTLFTAGFNIIMNLLRVFGELVMESFGSILSIGAEIIQFITNVFTGEWDAAWQNVANIFGECFKGILQVMKSVVNSILGVINGMIKGIETGINFMVDALNSIKIDLPDWITKLTGMTSFGFNLQKVELGQIPYLANGGVIESPTLAMVGEYPGAANNPEIVAPQSLLKETIDNSNNNVINSVFAMGNMIVKAIEDKDMNTYLDGMELSQGLYNHTGLIQRQKGNNLIK